MSIRIIKGNKEVKVIDTSKKEDVSPVEAEQKTELYCDVCGVNTWRKHHKEGGTCGSGHGGGFSFSSRSFQLR